MKGLKGRHSPAIECLDHDNDTKLGSMEGGLGFIIYQVCDPIIHAPLSLFSFRCL